MPEYPVTLSGLVPSGGDSDFLSGVQSSHLHILNFCSSPGVQIIAEPLFLPSSCWYSECSSSVHPGRLEHLGQTQSSV